LQQVVLRTPFIDPGVLEVGPDLQGYDDHRRGHRPGGSSLGDLGAEREELPSESCKEAHTNKPGGEERIMRGVSLAVEIGVIEVDTGVRIAHFPTYPQAQQQEEK
jgi:hypothetical protein